MNFFFFLVYSRINRWFRVNVLCYAAMLDMDLLSKHVVGKKRCVHHIHCVEQKLVIRRGKFSSGICSTHPSPFFAAKLLHRISDFGAFIAIVLWDSPKKLNRWLCPMGSKGSINRCIKKKRREPNFLFVFISKFDPEHRKIICRKTSLLEEHVFS